jgi:hypothetical protein
MDLVKRLRNGDTTVKINADGSIKYIKEEAADEIERLREALLKISSCETCGCQVECDDMVKIALDALKENV